jgi:hypothetical protein
LMDRGRSSGGHGNVRFHLYMLDCITNPAYMKRKIYQLKNPLLVSDLARPTPLLIKPGTTLPFMIVSSTTLGISCGVTRPYERYAPEGNNICSR